jgi:hypothetical protein
MASGEERNEPLLEIDDAGELLSPSLHSTTEMDLPLEVKIIVYDLVSRVPLLPIDYLR